MEQAADLNLEDPPGFLPADVIIEAGDLIRPLEAADDDAMVVSSPAKGEETHAALEAEPSTPAGADEVKAYIKSILYSPTVAAATSPLKSCSGWEPSQWEVVAGPLVTADSAEQVVQLLRVGHDMRLDSLVEWTLVYALPRLVKSLASAAVTDVTLSWGTAKAAAFADDVVRWSGLGSQPPAEFKRRLLKLELCNHGDVGASLEALLAEAYRERRTSE